MSASSAPRLLINPPVEVTFHTAVHEPKLSGNTEGERNRYNETELPEIKTK